MKILKRIGFVLLTICVFLVCAFIAFQAYGIYLTNRAYAPWKVDWNDTMGTIYRDIDVDEAAQTGYDLYLPGSPEPGKKYSLILHIHGGGFIEGDKADGETLCKYFTSQGYVCASVNYTLADEAHQSNLNLMFEQIRAQTASINAKAYELGYELTEMAVTGESAGGCLALLYAYREPENSPIPVKLVFEMTGPASFDPVLWGSADQEAGAAFIAMMTGETVTMDMMENGQAMVLADAISPAALVSEDTVPTLLAYGPKDKVIPINLKYSLMEALDKYHVPYDFIEFPHSGHTMALDPDKMQEYADKANEYLNKYFSN